MAEVKRNVVNGVNTILMHGKNYVEVCERVRLVHDQKREFEVLESVPFMVGDRCLWRVVVKVDGRLYTGNAEVKLNARPGTPDATNPFECGETSALGRALAFAGFGSVESIASFDEVYRATEASAMPQKASEKPATVQKTETSNHSTENGKAMPASSGQASDAIPAYTPERKAIVDALYDRGIKIEACETNDNGVSFARYLNKLLERKIVSVKALTDDDLSRIDLDLASREAQLVAK